MDAGWPETVLLVLSPPREAGCQLLLKVLRAEVGGSGRVRVWVCVLYRQKTGE